MYENSTVTLSHDAVALKYSIWGTLFSSPKWDGTCEGPGLCLGLCTMIEAAVGLVWGDPLSEAFEEASRGFVTQTSDSRMNRKGLSQVS